MGRKPENLVGQRFGRLLVREHVGSDANGKNAVWSCLCDCGKFSHVTAANLKSGHTASCGCAMGLGGKRGKIKAGEIRPRETAARRLAVKAAFAAGYTPAEICRALKISKATVSRDLSA